MFDFNNYVEVLSNAPVIFRPNEKAVVCFVNEADQDININGEMIYEGQKYYSIEFNDGEIIEIPEYYLSLIQESLII